MAKILKMWMKGDRKATEEEVRGYHLDDYFRGDRYLGPDEEGVYPIWDEE